MKHPTMTEKQQLRKSEFPFCAREALGKVEQLCVPQAGGRPPSAKEMDLAMEIMAEFIFCEVDRRGNRRKLTCVQQLQLAQVLCDYFAGVPIGSSGGQLTPSGDTVRNTLFLSLFPPTTGRERAQALVQLVSMAISTKNQPVLASTGIWMQQIGCTSKLVLQLADGLVKDYFVLVPKAVARLQDLPSLAPHFTANFLTTVAEMYFEQRESVSPPPTALLEVVTQWVSDNPSLCLAALMVNLQPLLPLGSIPMAGLTPFAGLFKWCILAPLHSITRLANRTLNSSSNGSSGISVKKETRDESSNKSLSNINSESQLYSKLHLALLESLVDKVYPTTTRDVVSARDLSAIAESVSHWCELHQNSLSASEKLPEECVEQEKKALELALDRLGQAVQVALAAQCVYGNRRPLLTQLDTLKHIPEGRLLRIVLQKQQEVL